MDLRINQQAGWIRLEISEPKLNIDIQPPQSNLEIKPPKIDIGQLKARLEIDQTRCFADAGLRKPVDFLNYLTGLAKTATLKAIASISAEGDMLAAIENGVDIADISRMSGQDWDEFDIAAVPAHRPVIDVFVEPVRIEVDRGSVVMTTRKGKVSGQLDWGKVDVAWRQRPMIDIEFSGSRLDTMI